MDKNTIIGFLLIFGILMAWQLTMAPQQKLLKEQEQARLDSLRLLEEKRADSLASLENLPIVPEETTQIDSQAIAQQQMQLNSEFGPFTSAATGEEEIEVLENEVMRILFTNKGGRIKEVELKQHYKIERDSAHKEFKVPLKLMHDKKDRFEYLLPVAGLPRPLSSERLFFTVSKQGDNGIAFRADAGMGRYFEQVYTIQPGESYAMQYQLNFKGLEHVLNADANTLRLQWVSFLDKLEENSQYERNYASVYYKPSGDKADFCSCTSSDEDDLPNKNIQWFAHSNQFFAGVLMTKGTAFKGGNFATEVLPPEDVNLKKLSTVVGIPLDQGDSYPMEFYIGPKEFDTLRAYKTDLEDIVPFGRSIIGTANRWVIRPLFNFLLSFISSKGLVILVLTLIVKLLLYPLSYKMLYSQAKMAALKPRLNALREKFKDDQSQIQMESMKMYREFGVNPLGGCLPVAIQMPVWLALYRFFPGSIEFRQASFLWATDLSSYDTAFWLPFNIPFYGEHVSLFTLLWVVSTLVYTYYNMQQMDMASMGGGANAKMMKYMQFVMPVFFLFFFNNYASGLTAYLVFSNIMNVTQTIVTRKWIIDHDKINEQLEAYRKKPKKKGGFQSRLEDALKQQQAIAAQREAAAKKKK